MKRIAYYKKHFSGNEDTAEAQNVLTRLEKVATKLNCSTETPTEDDSIDVPPSVVPTAPLIDDTGGDGGDGGDVPLIDPNNVPPGKKDDGGDGDGGDGDGGVTSLDCDKITSRLRELAKNAKNVNTSNRDDFETIRVGFDKLKK